MSLIKYLPVLDITDLPRDIKDKLYASSFTDGLGNNSYFMLDISEYRAYMDAGDNYARDYGQDMADVMAFVATLTTEGTVMVQYWW